MKAHSGESVRINANIHGNFYKIILVRMNLNVMKNTDIC